MKETLPNQNLPDFDLVDLVRPKEVASVRIKLNQLAVQIFLFWFLQIFFAIWSDENNEKSTWKNAYIWRNV